MKVVMAALISLLGILQARAACEDQLSLLDEQAKKHPRQGDAAQVQKNLKNAHALVEVDELGCLNAVSRARRALAVPAPEDQTSKPSSGAVQPLNQPQNPVQPLNQPEPPVRYR